MTPELSVDFTKQDEEMMQEIFARYHRPNIDDVNSSQVAFDIGRLQGTISRLKSAEKEAYKRGAESMRERAAGEVQDWAEKHEPNSETKRMLLQLSGTVRILPIEEPK